MTARRPIALAICCLLPGFAAYAGDAGSGAGFQMNAADIAMPVTRDAATVSYVERAHLQLDRWGARLVSRLERGQGPRQSDPMLDGRYGLQVLKIRLTYAGYAQSPELAEAIRRLADTHDQRRRRLEKMMRYGVNREAFASASSEADRVMSNIRVLGSQ